MGRAERLAEIAAAAVELERRLSYPPRLLIAQWALESRWGEQVSGDNNYFGVTYAPGRHVGYRWCPTREVLTEAGIKAISPAEQATITHRHARPDGKFDVQLSRRFASYATAADGLADKVRLIQFGERYRPAWQQYLADRDVEQLIRAIAPIYATDPAYAETLITISRQTNVREAIEAARAKAA